jgi:nucleoid DNA-binding protein
MNKIELEAAIAEKAGVPKKVVAEVISAQLAIITDTLANGESVKLTGFATLSVKDSAARVGKNPKTGEPINIPAKRKVAVKAGKDLVSAVNA